MNNQRGTNGGGVGSGGRALERSADPAFGRAITRIMQRKSDMSEERRRSHMCDARVCNPQNEAAFYDDPETSNVFLCRFGSVHLCSAYECPYFSETHSQACPISRMDIGSGPATSSYDAGDSRTWYSKLDTGTAATAPPTPPAPVAAVPIVVPQRAAALPTDDAIALHASAVVKLLLFSRYRVACNKVAHAVHKQEARDSLHTYRKSQLSKRQPQHMTDKYRVRAHFMSQPLPYAIYEFSPDLHDYYVNICLQVWRLAVRYYDNASDMAPRLDFQQLCLGVMYTMRQGRLTAGVVLLPKDDFLLFNLPLISHLTAFGITKNQVTKGEKILSQTYDNAIAGHHVDPRSLALDVTIMPQKRAEEEVDEEEPEEGAARVKVRVTSSGEKLFMPSSRRK